MAAFELEVQNVDDRPVGKRVAVVTLGSAPPFNLCRVVRIIATQIGATASSVAWVNLGKFSVPIGFPALASPINFAFEIYNGAYAPIEISDFSFAPNQVPAGMVGALALFLVEH